jgi:hypothetical protein
MSKKLNLVAALVLCLLFAAPSIHAQGATKFGRPNMEEKYNKKLPEMHEALHGCGKWQTSTMRC